MLLLLDENQLEQCISEYARSNGSWDLEKLSQFLPEDFVEVIFAIKAPKPIAGPDVPTWFPSLDGKFQLKSAFVSWVDNDFANRNKLFKNIWKVRTPQRIKS